MTTAMRVTTHLLAFPWRLQLPYIDGPGVVVSPGFHTWSAKRWGGTGSYSYLWTRSDDGQTYCTVGTGNSYTIQTWAGDCYPF
ncbi:MAG: hypothetical protein ACREL7_00490 [Longimicrobiales bacterium]